MCLPIFLSTLWDRKKKVPHAENASALAQLKSIVPEDVKAAKRAATRASVMLLRTTSREDSSSSDILADEEAEKVL